MLGFKKARPIEGHEAEGETERIYHEIRQVLRVTGVNLSFRALAVHGRSFVAIWDEIRPNAETRTFEDLADQLRARAVEHAQAIPRLDASSRTVLGASQRHQLESALSLYHYVNPKLLLLNSALKMAFEGDGLEGAPIRAEGNGHREGTGPDVGHGTGDGELIERGEPGNMVAMEMVVDPPEERPIREVFDDIKHSLSLEWINSDYRTLALWPGYLRSAWEGLKPVVMSESHRNASTELREMSRTLARALPYPLTMGRAQVRRLGEDPDAVAKVIGSFDRVLASLCIQVALFALDFRDAGALARSPFPAGARTLWLTPEGDVS